MWTRVKILFEKAEQGEGHQFVNKVVGDNIPKEYIPAIEKGIGQISKTGVLAGYPLIDFKATLIDGAYHDVDSSALAFEIAGRSNIEVVTLDDYIGDVIHKEGNEILKKLSSDIETLVLEDNHNQSILLDMKSYTDINNLKDYNEF